MIPVSILGLLTGLAKANLMAGAAVLVVLALRRPVRGWFGARAAYALWLAPLAAAAAVLLPQPRMMTPISPIVLSAEAAAADAAGVFVAEPRAAVREDLRRPDAPALLFGVWLAGVLAAGGLTAWRQGRFVAAMGRLTPSETPRVFRAESAQVGPAVVGVLRPRIVAPADFETRFGADERALILTHERMHLAGGDAAINALACLLRCLCWFNPLVHLGVRALRIDQELACDAAVIGRFPQMRRAYAELLLKTQIVSQPLPLGCHWPAGAEHPLKARIAMLKSPLPRPSRRAAGLAVAGLAAVSAGGLAWAAHPGPGASERLAAQAAAALHPSYSCDRALELAGGGCKIVAVQIWEAVPTREDVLRHYPAAALKAGVSAEVRIGCDLTANGLLAACTPVQTTLRSRDGAALDELALEQQFGKAAVALSAYYQMRSIDPGPGARSKPGHAGVAIRFSPEAGGPIPPPPPGSVPAGAAPAAPAQVSAAPPPARKLLAAFEAPALASAPMIVKPDWIERPVPADVAEFYPKAALATHTEGSTTMHCTVAVTGELKDCRTTREEPLGQGFGEAALALAAKFKMKPQTKDGVPTSGGEINIPIRFMLPSEPAAPSATSPRDAG